ncbi:hypothetical protein [Variovorax rhizosphaerae]|uniref:SF3 helicase domain-containing protein n=1 Tax=Variovorax rhizosphaerae TaxID=1836200 RepID=A0ABU8WSC2_9BURK
MTSNPPVFILPQGFTIGTMARLLRTHGASQRDVQQCLGQRFVLAPQERDARELADVMPEHVPACVAYLEQVAPELLVRAVPMAPPCVPPSSPPPSPPAAPSPPPALPKALSATALAPSSAKAPPKPKAPAINFDAIPHELQAGQFFVMWRFVPKKDKQGKLKWTKPPMQRDGSLASTTNSATWCSFDEARAALALRRPNGSPFFDGMGRVFCPDDPMQTFGFDLDNCIAPDANAARRLSADAQEAVRELSTYAELSPSGDGVHIIGKGKLPGAHYTNNKLGREAYDSSKAGRYLTITGQVLPGFDAIRQSDSAMLAKWHALWDTHAPSNRATPPHGARAQEPTTSPGSVQFIANVILEGRGLPQDAVDLIRHQAGLDKHYNSDGSLGVYAACIEMARAGFTDVEMISVLTDSENALAEVVLRRRAHSRQSAAQWLVKYQLKQARKAAAQGLGAAQVQGKGDHYGVAMAFIDRIEMETGHRPVYSRGSFWTVNDNLWEPLALDQAAVHVGRHFGGRKNVMKSGDFKAIATLAANAVEDADFFDAAPAGVAGPDKFWRVDGGKVVSELLTPDHRQRMRLPTEPEFGSPPPMFIKVLTDSMGAHARGNEQVHLLRLCLGAALVGTLWKYRVALCLKGPTTAGKSVVLAVFRSLFPKDMVGATNPAKWDKEYFVAALAGRRLNIVGELDSQAPIPGGAFKTVTGGDVIEGRHPTHRPFHFVCLCAHIFNGNQLPPTTDRSNAFFVRWRVVVFEKARASGEVIVSLADKIIATELAQVAGWLLEGAAVLPQGTLPTTAAHEEEVRRWRYANNSAAAFAVDPSWCSLVSSAEISGELLYSRYCVYAKETGTQSFKRTTFYDNLMELGGALGIARIERNHAVWFAGIQLVAHETPFFDLERVPAPLPTTELGAKPP